MDSPLLCRFLDSGTNDLASIDSQGRVVVSRLTFVGPDEDIKVEIILDLHIEGTSKQLGAQLILLQDRGGARMTAPCRMTHLETTQWTQ